MQADTGRQDAEDLAASLEKTTTEDKEEGKKEDGSPAK